MERRTRKARRAAQPFKGTAVLPNSVSVKGMLATTLMGVSPTYYLSTDCPVPDLGMAPLHDYEPPDFISAKAMEGEYERMRRELFLYDVHSQQSIWGSIG
jgi:hypothetical protein